MEKTLVIYVDAIKETWELPDDLVLKLNEYKAEHPVHLDNSNADEVHQGWFASLSKEEQQKVSKHKPDEEAG